MPMPVVWCDGFDSTDSTHEATWYTTADFTVGTPGRFGVGQYATVGTSAFKTIPGGPYTYMGAARAVRWGTIAGEPILFEFGGTSQHCRMLRNASGFVFMKDASSTTIQTYLGAALQANIWYHVAFYAKWDGAGNGQLRGFLNGNLVLSMDGVDTHNAAPNEFSYFLIGGGDVDDLYVQAADPIVGNLADQFKGDRIVRDHFPQSDGDHQQWTQSTGGTKFGVVDEVGPNDDTDYLSDATPGNRVCFGVGSLAPDIASIDAVQLMSVGRFDTTGPHAIKNYVREVGVANHDQANQALTVTHAGYHDVLEVDPATGSGWSKPGFEARQYGVKDES